VVLVLVLVVIAVFGVIIIGIIVKGICSIDKFVGVVGVLSG